MKKSLIKNAVLLLLVLWSRNLVADAWNLMGYLSAPMDGTFNILNLISTEASVRSKMRYGAIWLQKSGG